MRYGVIGTGWIAKSFIDGARMLTDSEFAAVYSRTAESGKKSVIRRLFNDKYPYEYLNSDGGKAQADQIVQFYRERGF